MNPIALGSRWLAYAENKVRRGSCLDCCNGASVEEFAKGDCHPIMNI